MPNPFLRPDERDRERSKSTPGVCVWPPDGRRYFFPGATEDLAMFYAKAALGALMEDPMTRVEYGEAEETNWRRRRTLAGPVTDDGYGTNQ